MAKIHTLKISNYRGIKKLEQSFNGNNLICLIGRGDSGKSTILNAISAVLSPYWDYTFYDTDFHDGEMDNPIEIESSLYDLPEELLTDSKYGLYKQVLTKDNRIIDDIFSEEDEDTIDVLTIRLVVNKDLEPKWYVVNGREQQEDIEIKAGDRAKLNVFLVSDYLDRHFSWGKGSPLYSLLRGSSIDIETDKILLEANQKAKQSIKDSDSFNSFDGVIEILKEAARSIGLSEPELNAFIDFKNILLKEGNITLHKNGIPFRLKGKGSKRLLSIAIQLELAKKGGIVLIDEIEQGLEPDRARFLAKYLKDKTEGQVFITTHSSNVIVELAESNLFLMKDGAESLFSFCSEFQGCLRNNPEAFFAKRVIVCEGATEVGICRTINNHRIKLEQLNLEVLGISLVDGTGSNFVKYCKDFKVAGFDVCAFCDSDDNGINLKKKELTENHIKIIDCDNSKSIEQQLFNDLPWSKIQELIEYVIEKKEQQFKDVTGIKDINNLKKETPELRTLIGLKSKDIGWFKRIEHGEFIGKIWIDSLPDMEDKTLVKQYYELMAWIDGWQ
jgi:predicted ATP-dependent endonuclease of OLD family